MRTQPDLASGVYKHYKGPLYLVLGYGHDANADTLGTCATDGRGHRSTYYEPLDERTVVVYVGLELDGAKTGARLAVRTAEDFLGWVNPETGETVVTPHDAAERRRVWRLGGRPRFTYCGPTWEGEHGDSRG